MQLDSNYLMSASDAIKRLSDYCVRISRLNEGFRNELENIYRLGLELEIIC